MVQPPPYVVFGQVIEGVDVVLSDRESANRAQEIGRSNPVVIKTIKIERVK